MQAEGEIVQLPTERAAPPKDFRMFFEEEHGHRLPVRTRMDEREPGGRAWAPSGNAIAYSAPEGDSYSTYVVDAETHRVTPGGFPAWLNDHTVIVQG
jgi:hypothetical protein